MNQLLVLFPLLLVALLHAREQAVKVKGILICGNWRIGKGKANVKLMEHDWPDKDDHMGSVEFRNFSGSMGEFWISGSSDERTDIEPYLVIEHTCNTEEGCRRETPYDIPENYINSEEWWNMDYVNLQIFTEHDKTICD